MESGKRNLILNKIVMIFIALAFTLAFTAFSQVNAGAESGETKENRFCLTVISSSRVVVEPEMISYDEGDTIKQALMKSGHDFDGIENGYIYAVDDISGNYSRYYDGGKYDLDESASSVTALYVTETSNYSEELIKLIAKMSEFKSADNNVQKYQSAATAYSNALSALNTCDAASAQSMYTELCSAISDYEAILNGEKYKVSVEATLDGKAAKDPVITMTDEYGNVTTATGNSIEVIEGAYTYAVSDGGYRRTEGTIDVSADENANISVTLPVDDWFGEVKLLRSGDKAAYAYENGSNDHSRIMYIPDNAGSLSVIVYAEMGKVPDEENTKLYPVYTDTTGTLVNDKVKSWESTAGTLIKLVDEGMQGNTLSLEARYTCDEGYTWIEAYECQIQRVPTLTSIKAVGDNATLPLLDENGNVVSFSADTDEYWIDTVSDSINLTLTMYGIDYSILPGNAKWSAEGADFSANINAAADTDEKITVSASSGETNTITLHVKKYDSVNVTCDTPSGTTVKIYNKAGAEIGAENGVYHLVPGTEYEYISTKQEYFHCKESFTAKEGLVIDVKEPKTQDGLTAVAVYNGGNVNTRSAYESDEEFSADKHTMTYIVPDYMRSIYTQTTADGYTVQAYYNLQKKDVNDGTAFSKKLTHTVNSSKACDVLGNALRESGFSNTVTVRLSQTSGQVEYYQDYFLKFVRSEHLKKLTLSDEYGSIAFYEEGDAQKTSILFNRQTTSYAVSVERGCKSINLAAEFTNEDSTYASDGGYYAIVNGERYDSLSSLDIALDETKDKENIDIEVLHSDTDCRSTVYRISVEKTEPIYIAECMNPADGTFFIQNNLTGRRIYPITDLSTVECADELISNAVNESGCSESDVYIYSLTPGGSYSYNATKSGYKGVQETDYETPSENGVLYINLEKAPESTHTELESIWPSLRADDSNNGVINSPTPSKASDATLYWATKLGDGYSSDACGCPIIVDGCLYTYAKDMIYKVDCVSGEILASGKMDHSSSFAINSPTYAEGMIFIGLSDGTVQAFDASTLESIWIYHDSLKGQPNCPITYHDGYIYTGFWLGETSNAHYVCLSVTDEDPDNTLEEKIPVWTYTQKGGFYWAGAYVSDDYLIIGTDDGENGYTTGHAQTLSMNPKTGEIIDSVMLEQTGDIRSSITFESDGSGGGTCYFTTKGGYFYGFKVNADGTFDRDQLKYIQLYNYANDPTNPAMSTCTPTIYNGRAYIGVSGVAQFGAYSGHNITVIDINSWTIAYTVRTQGYPQTSGVLTTYYEESTGDAYVYFFDNFTPGKLRVLSDHPGQTQPSVTETESYVDKGVSKNYSVAQVLFTPYAEQAQYAICSPVIDENGTIYFKNDSAYLMAVGSTIKELQITKMPNKTKYKTGSTFDSTGMQVTAVYTNGTTRDVTKYVTWSEEPLTEDDEQFQITFPYTMYQDGEDGAGTSVEHPFAVIDLTIGDNVDEDPDYTLGDVNNDGLINTVDVMLAYAIVDEKAGFTGSQENKDAGVFDYTRQEFLAADVNKDGAVTKDDAELIYQYHNGTISDW